MERAAEICLFCLDLQFEKKKTLAFFFKADLEMLLKKAMFAMTSAL